MNFKKVVFVLILVLVESFVKCGEDDSFDYYYFVRLWLGNDCSNDACVNVHVNDFTIHGLWPNYADGKWPQWCHVGTNGFQEHYIDDLLGELEKWWPSYVNSPNADEKFWAHEWNKHGTCALPEFHYSERDFFTTILNLHHEYNISNALEYNNIYPSEDIRFSTDVFEQSLNSYFGKRMYVSCWRGGLSEVWMCFDLNLNLIDCPVQASNCGDIYYEPFETQQIYEV
eukprot:TRINITY_DN44394_c0_g1_i1.p1 TRINITY_DN44394_c0_g1~~TRINITY_DN44394_c0_g1_i1.p1  ORF type:complete len:227 (-),score=15.72 TRINITY_DN44394_c0_g1_i1:877-1557(-)